MLRMSSLFIDIARKRMERNNLKFCESQAAAIVINRHSHPCPLSPVHPLPPSSNNAPPPPPFGMCDQRQERCTDQRPNNIDIVILEYLKTVLCREIKHKLCKLYKNCPTLIFGKI